MGNNTIFGIRPVLEAIESGRQIEKIYMRKGAEGQLLGELREICRRRHLNVQEVPVEKLDRLVRSESRYNADRRPERGGHGSAANHQGVVAAMSAIAYSTLEDILSGIPKDQTPLLVIFDGVTDVRNFGAIARSAECAGAHGLITPLKNSAPVNADAIKTSAGALNKIPVCRVGSIRNTVKALRSEGMQVVAATEKSGTPLFGSDMTKPTVIVMGGEDAGISKEVLKLCDVELAIPIAGSIESLNVSAAAAVMLFEAVRQRMG